jgi:hypothetical protein
LFWEGAQRVDLNEEVVMAAADMIGNVRYTIVVGLMNLSMHNLAYCDKWFDLQGTARSTVAAAVGVSLSVLKRHLQDYNMTSLFDIHDDNLRRRTDRNAETSIMDRQLIKELAAEHKASQVIQHFFIIVMCEQYIIHSM